MSVLTVTGAFATHTTRLYNYHILEVNDIAEERVSAIGFVAVNYMGRLQYLGRVKEVARWKRDEATGTIDPRSRGSEIRGLPRIPGHGRSAAVDLWSATGTPLPRI
jgi:hypothetical protein